MNRSRLRDTPSKPTASGEATAEKQPKTTAEFHLSRAQKAHDQAE
ncbi:MAG: hypothetical protein WAS36_04530 [Candidatus Saccharimonadales bacterium]